LLQTPLAQSAPVMQVVFGRPGGMQNPPVHVPLWQSLACVQCEPAGDPVLAPPVPPVEVEPPPAPPVEVETPPAPPVEVETPVEIEPPLDVELPVAVALPAAPPAPVGPEVVALPTPARLSAEPLPPHAAKPATAPPRLTMHVQHPKYFMDCLCPLERESSAGTTDRARHSPFIGATETELECGGWRSSG
jgi:hypothetical protein